HIHDIALAPILPVLYAANVGALSIELANPRHQHEYETLRAVPLPKDWLLIPGVIDTTTNFVEHPQLVARRILQAMAAARERGSRSGLARPRDRLHRLGVWHVRRPRVGRGEDRREKAPLAARGRRHRLRQSLGPSQLAKLIDRSGPAPKGGARACASGACLLRL